MQILVIYRTQVLPIIEEYVKQSYETIVYLEWGSSISNKKNQTFDCILLDTSSLFGEAEDAQMVIELRDFFLKTPLILITKQEESYQYRERMFNAGIDVVLQVPFLSKELDIRIKKVLAKKDALIFSGTRITVGVIEMDIRTHRVYESGRVVDLTRLEYSFLFHLFLYQNRHVMRHELVEYLDGNNKNMTLGVHMFNLRKKFLNQNVIRTIPHYGFMVVT